MIQQAKLIYAKRKDPRYPAAIGCEWQAVTNFPHIHCDPLRFEVINVLPDFWGRPVLAVNGSNRTYYFAFDTPAEAGKIVAYYIAYWTGYKEANP
jgi:hypothetical protein